MRFCCNSTVANDVGLVGMDQTAGEKVEGELLVTNNNGVAGIGTTVEASNNVVPAIRHKCSSINEREMAKLDWQPK